LEGERTVEMRLDCDRGRDIGRGCVADAPSEFECCSKWCGWERTGALLAGSGPKSGDASTCLISGTSAEDARAVVF
jgi:hypothetical protein